MAHFNIKSLIREGEAELTSSGEPAIGATFLMMDLFQFSKLEIMLNDQVLTAEQADLYKEGIMRLKQHEPLAHITGFQMFYDRKFYVDHRVLVPRQETEELVALALNYIKAHHTVADIGTGSGVIAITAQLESHCNMYAVDISRDALHVAKRNSDHLKADVTWLAGDLLAPIRERNIKLDVLLSNPPYIAAHERDVMNKTALFDPELALFAEDSGLALYKRMIDSLPEVMNNNGFVAFEIGHNQASALVAYIHQKYERIHVDVHKDINGCDRILSFTWCE
ncbi:peptide chain release factor N(5)-glutamine methyltransferase [Macrococcus armenti]|uniref:peptide chain release factor N(5)-glutamine methyltransferase n=1 Tax=Macrococcus armenti TaxID=2875764 RepID=UPI001CCF994E|nr:peptide chain release factor N(5)-glutamine methyltransferase [Macrococcus armenti]UBH08405.1 peptide chain release factor N(5)-glutamine methyltransferase [Macrococcus armenti]UBH10692.1 peptide chain release factor N(5)-glutamine methyltransferase [Macrococcus armenti]